MGSWFSAITRTGRLPAFMIACGCVALLYGFLLSGDFDVNDVTVRGAHLGDPREIAGATGAFGTSLFKVQPERIAGRLAALPYVEQVQVETRLPSRVVVTVTEREPVLVWVAADGPYLVDIHGKVLMAGENDGLPRVVGDAMRMQAGNTIPHARVAAVTAIQDAIGTSVDVVAWSERNGITVRLQNEQLVIFGSPDRFPLKLAVFQEIRTRELTWSVLDLREPDRPYYE